MRELYRRLEGPGDNALREAQDDLDEAVRGAYGFSAGTDVLEALFEVNQDLAEAEKQGSGITGPGLPGSIKDQPPYITGDCISA